MTTTTPTPRPDPTPVHPAQRLLAGLAAAATLPYIGLKLHWLTGGRTGLIDPDFGQGTAMHLLNAATLGLDVVALALAGVFITRRGRRAPAWLVLPPMWVGAGLLGQILVALPVTLVAESSAPSRPSTAPPPPIAEWVYGLVYADFSLLGIGLLGAFALYARQRWAGAAPSSATSRQRTWLRAAAALLTLAAAAHLTLAGTPLTARVVDAAVALAGAGALLALTTDRMPRRRLLAAVAIAFAATGAAAAWGTYQLVIAQVNDFVSAADATALETAGQVIRAAAGILGGAALAIRLRPGPVEGPHRRPRVR